MSARALDAFSNQNATTLPELLTHQGAAALILFWDSLNTPAGFRRVLQQLSESSIRDQLEIYTVDTKRGFKSVHAAMEPHGIDIMGVCRCSSTSSAWHRPSGVHLFDNIVAAVVANGNVRQVTTAPQMTVRSFILEVSTVLSRTATGGSTSAAAV